MYVYRQGPVCCKQTLSETGNLAPLAADGARRRNAATGIRANGTWLKIDERPERQVSEFLREGQCCKYKLQHQWEAHVVGRRKFLSNFPRFFSLRVSGHFVPPVDENTLWVSTLLAFPEKLNLLSSYFRNVATAVLRSLRAIGANKYRSFVGFAYRVLLTGLRMMLFYFGLEI